MTTRPSDKPSEAFVSILYSRLFEPVPKDVADLCFKPTLLGGHVSPAPEPEPGTPEWFRREILRRDDEISKLKCRLSDIQHAVERIAKGETCCDSDW